MTEEVAKECCCDEMIAKARKADLRGVALSWTCTVHGASGVDLRQVEVRYVAPPMGSGHYPRRGGF